MPEKGIHRVQSANNRIVPTNRLFISPPDNSLPTARTGSYCFMNWFFYFRTMIDVTCALIIGHNGEILVAQRSSSMRLPLKWEFPGGKTEPGEKPEECLVREIAEELNVIVEIIRPLLPYEHHDAELAIRLIPFVCRIISGEITLTEHAAYVWSKAEDLPALDWADADIPVYQQYLDFLRHSKKTS